LSVGWFIQRRRAREERNPPSLSQRCCSLGTRVPEGQGACGKPAAAEALRAIRDPDLYVEKRRPEQWNRKRIARFSLHPCVPARTSPTPEAPAFRFCGGPSALSSGKKAAPLSKNRAKCLNQRKTGKARASKWQLRRLSGCGRIRRRESFPTMGITPMMVDGRQAELFVPRLKGKNRWRAQMLQEQIRQ
jgi:hypothetical protein